MNDKKIEKKLYIWRLALFLHSNNMNMSGDELAAHLNRNKIKTGYGSEYAGSRGTYTLIKTTYNWVKDMGLENEAKAIAEAYVKPDGTHAWDS
jgi:hypothetical protein